MSLLKGGNVALQAVPVKTYAYEYGGNESDNATQRLLHMADRQNDLNNSLSGGRGKRIKRGGSQSIEIPQFSITGPRVSIDDANSASYRINSTLVEATNSAMYDDKIQTGGKRKTKKSKMKYNNAHISGHKKGCRCKLCCQLRNRLRKTKRTKRTKSRRSRRTRK